LPLTAALFPSLNREERFIPILPSRLHLQSLVHCHWSRVPNSNVRCQQLKLSDTRGWSIFVEDPGKNNKMLLFVCFSLANLNFSTNGSSLHTGRGSLYGHFKFS